MTCDELRSAARGPPAPRGARRGPGLRRVCACACVCVSEALPVAVANAELPARTCAQSGRARPAEMMWSKISERHQKCLRPEFPSSFTFCSLGFPIPVKSVPRIKRPAKDKAPDLNHHWHTGPRQPTFIWNPQTSPREILAQLAPRRARGSASRPPGPATRCTPVPERLTGSSSVFQWRTCALFQARAVCDRAVRAGARAGADRPSCIIAVPCPRPGRAASRRSHWR